MRQHLLTLLAVSGLVGCGGADRNSNATATKGEYIIEIFGDHSARLEADDVNTTWDPASGLVYLSTDENNEPLGTLTMTVGAQIDAGIKEYAVLTALLSKTDVRVGTAAELNARLFEFTEGSLTNVEIGSNFIRGSLGLKMSRVLVHASDEPEHVNVIGTFTALSN